MSSDFGGTTFGAQVGTVQSKGDPKKDEGSSGMTSASFGVTLPSGLSVGGAWGKGNELVGSGRSYLPGEVCRIATSAPGQFGY